MSGMLLFTKNKASEGEIQVRQQFVHICNVSGKGRKPPTEAASWENAWEVGGRQLLSAYPFALYSVP